MSSLERLPSDETDDGNVRLTAQEPEASKSYNNPGKYKVHGHKDLKKILINILDPNEIAVAVSGAAGGIMGWTARAGSFVVEKMNIFSYTESVPNTSIAHKQPSFLERYVTLNMIFRCILHTHNEKIITKKEIRNYFN